MQRERSGCMQDEPKRMHVRAGVGRERAGYFRSEDVGLVRGKAPTGERTAAVRGESREGIEEERYSRSLLPARRSLVRVLRLGGRGIRIYRGTSSSSASSSSSFSCRSSLPTSPVGAYLCIHIPKTHGSTSSRSREELAILQLEYLRNCLLTVGVHSSPARFCLTAQRMTRAFFFGDPVPPRSIFILFRSEIIMDRALQTRDL